MWCRANVTADSFTNKEGALVKDFPRAKIAVPVLGIMSKDEFLLTGQMEGSGKFIEPPGSWRWATGCAVSFPEFENTLKDSC